MAETNPGAKEAKTDTKIIVPDTKAAGDGLPEYGSGDDLNSTMMAIDVAKLNLDATRTGIRLENPVVQGSADEEITNKTAIFNSLKEKFFTRHDADPSHNKRYLPEKLRPWQGVWFADPNASLAGQLAFYLLRIFVVLGCLYLQSVFVGELMRSFDILHPARYLFAIAFGAQLGGILLVILSKASPTWLFSLPLAVLALIMSYGALFYHTADPLYFNISARPISEALNAFYLIALTYALITSACIVVHGRVMRLLFTVLGLLCVVPVLINVQLAVPLEYGFFGPGFLNKISVYELQPLTISLHLFMPILTVLLITHALLPIKVNIPEEGRSVARSLSVLMLCLLVLSFALMQKNRVFHVFNFIFPRTLNVGGIENKILNQDLKIVTSNFAENEGVDEKARYKFRIEKAAEKDKYVLKLLDSFNFPVKFITKEDLAVYSDDKEIKDYQLVEEDDPKLDSGHYLLTLSLFSKEAPVEWPMDKQSLDSSDKFVFKLNDVAKVKRFLVKRDEDILLDVTSPKTAEIALPLFYFQPGAHKLDVHVFDELEQESFHDTVNLNIKFENDFMIFAPAPDTTVGKELAVVLGLKGVVRDTVRGVEYSLNGKPVYQSTGMNYYHTLDLASYPDGDMVLKIRMQIADKEVVHEIKLHKSNAAPKLTIVQPALGVFAEHDTTVNYKMSDPQKTVTDTQVLVNGTPFTDFTTTPGSLDLPVSRWEGSELVITVATKLTSGETVSAWVQINRGLSVLDFKYDLKTLLFLNVSKVAVVLDASVSSLDNWQGKSKWYNMTNVLLAPEVESHLKNFNPVFVAFGNKKPYYFGDCNDVDVLTKGDQDYNKAAIKHKLDDVIPKGVSALAKAIEKAYTTKPEKIFVFSDAADSCDANLVEALRPTLATSPQTVIDVFSLGKVLEHDRKQLIDLTVKTGGRYYQPADYDALLTALLEQLSLNFELYSGDKQIDRAPLEDKEYRLAPGSYTLKIPYGTGTEVYKFNLEHGTKNLRTIMGVQEDGKWKINIKEEKAELL